MSVGEQKPKALYQFGPFRVDPKKEILFRDGEPVPLTPKAFQVLLVLVRHGPEMVSKEDMMKAVWPDTFVEEANLSRNIFLLRKALGEGPQDHRYVLTVPGRGYRLAESVQLLPSMPEPTEEGEEKADDLSVSAASHSRIHLRMEEKPRRRWIVSATIAVLALAGLGIWWLWHRVPKLTERDTVVLAGFTNTTGDPIFDETLRQGLVVQLEQSPYLSLVSEDRIQRTLHLMGRPSDTRLTPDVAREICERTGAAVVLEGAIRSLGTAYVLGLRAKTCGSGTVLDEEQIQAAKKEEVLGALSQIATRFRERVGESLASVEKYSVPLEDATTTSLEALQSYSRAVKVAFTSGFTSAVPLMQRAVEIDPQFALAHSHLGLFYSAIGESELAVDSDRKAYELRDRVSERERFFLTAVYERNVTGNLQKALQTLQLWARTYPHDILPHSLLSGFMSQGLGRYQLSIDEAKITLNFDAEITPAYVNQAFSQLYLDRPQDAENTVQQAFAHKLRIPELLLLQYLLAYQKGEHAAMDQAIAAGQDKPGAEDWLLHAQSLALARSGRLTAAREASEHAVQLAETAGEHERAATYEGAVAVWEALYGNSAAARAKAKAALQLSNGRDTEYAAAFALAVADDSERAQELANDLQKRFPEDTSVMFNYLPALQGLLALRRGAPEEAIHSLRPAAPYELAASAIDFNYFFGNFNPVYARGQALLAAGRPAEASPEFNNIITHRGLLMVDPLDAIARLQLARAYTKMGDASKAKAAYANLFSIWRDADRDLPLVTQAKAEFAKIAVISWRDLLLLPVSTSKRSYTPRLNLPSCAVEHAWEFVRKINLYTADLNSAALRVKQTLIHQNRCLLPNHANPCVIKCARSDLPFESSDAIANTTLPVATKSRSRITRDFGREEVKKRDNTIAFFEHCIAQRWIKSTLDKDRGNPARGLTRIVGRKDSSIPTLPFTPAQFEAVLRACTGFDLSLETVNKVEVRNKGKRLHALCNLMRWSGLAITDAVTLQRSRLGRDDRLVLYRTKTGNPVTILLPREIADELRSVPPGPDAHPDYFFWSKRGKKNKAATTWQKALRRLWKLVRPALNLQDRDGRRIQPKSHMFRNPFAVKLLKRDVSLEHVAMLLGDTPDTVRDHYYPWVPALQKELERAVKSTWAKPGSPVIMDDVDKTLAIAGRA